MSDQPKVAGLQPQAVTLQEGKNYAWCTCGHSTNQPFCDGSHSGTGFTPFVFKAEKEETAYLCMCKRTCNQPRCDGSHSQVEST